MIFFLSPTFHSFIECGATAAYRDRDISDMHLSAIQVTSISAEFHENVQRLCRRKKAGRITYEINPLFMPYAAGAPLLTQRERGETEHT